MLNQINTDRTMKKTYLSPETLTVKVNTEHLLVTFSNSEAASNAAALGRDNDDRWDDED